jgi:putative membrane protein
VKRLALTTAFAVLALGACRNDVTTNEGENVAAADNNVNAAADGNTAMATADAAFLTDAMQSDNNEVAIGQLAQAQGASQKVKDFGKMIATDHGAHKQEVAALANSAGVPVTDDPSVEGTANLDKLKALSGAEFDKQLKAMAIASHTKGIAKYEQQAKSGDAQTAALANKTLPTLRKHLDMANAL